MKTIETTMDIPYFQFDNKWSKQLTSNNDNEILEALSEIYDIKVENYSRKQIEAMMYRLSMILGVNPKTNKRYQEPKLHQTFILNGKEYGIIPNFSNIKFDELMSLENALQTQDILTLFSILYREVLTKDNKFYTIKEMDGVNEEFKDIKLGVVEGAFDFFFTSFRQLSPIFPYSFLQTERVKLK